MRTAIILGITLFLVTFATYSQILQHDFVDIDDNDYVVDNVCVTTGVTASNVVWAFTSFYQSNWHPLTWLSHMTDVQLFGMNPRGHHLMSLLIHAGSTLLLFTLLFRLTLAPWKSAFVAALFALHPLHVESVAWVSERKDVLSAGFVFLTLILYVEFVRQRKRHLYWLALFSFILGLMSKPMLVTLPILMLLIDFWPLQRCAGEMSLPSEQRHPSLELWFSLVKEKLPFFLCALLSAAVTIYAQKDGLKSVYVAPLGLRLANAVCAYIKYIAKTFWPTDLAILYPFPTVIPYWQSIGALLLLLLLTLASILGRRHPYLLTGWLWFLVTLLPTLGLLQVGHQAIADRYTYIPVIGLFLLVAWGVPEWIGKLCRQQQIALVLLAGFVLVAATLVTWRQLSYWRNNTTLFEHTLHVTTDNYFAHNNLGVSYAKAGDFDRAIGEFRKSIAINANYSSGYNNLGHALACKGELDEAIVNYHKALEIAPDNAAARYNLVDALNRKGRFEEAAREFEKIRQ